MQIAEHAHCEICGKVVEVGTRFCSEACDEKHQEIQAEKKKFIWKQVALIAAVALIFTALRLGWL